MKTHQLYSSNFRMVMVLIPVLIGLTAIFSSCAFNVPAVDPSKRQTDVARSVESTLNAEKVATFQAQQTQAAVEPLATQTQTPDINATIQAQQATLDAQATSQAPQETLPVVALTTPTSASVSSLDPIQITDWKLSYWISLPNGCKAGAPCWKTDDDYTKHQGSPMVLTSKQSFLIDPGWPKPYLVFWNKRDNSYSATVELIVDGKRNIVKQYIKGKFDWQKETIDLSKFKGQEIYVLFSVQGKQGSLWGDTSGPGSHWFVEEVQILPDYSY
jgi:hypothetical protein